MMSSGVKSVAEPDSVTATCPLKSRAIYCRVAEARCDTPLLSSRRLSNVSALVSGSYAANI